MASRKCEKMIIVGPLGKIHTSGSLQGFEDRFCEANALADFAVADKVEMIEAMLRLLLSSG